MTLQERVVFINKVRGKKIYNKWWKIGSYTSSNIYFVPNGNVYKIPPFGFVYSMEGILTLDDGSEQKRNFLIEGSFCEWEILPEELENPFVQFSDPGIDTHSPMIGPKSLKLSKVCPHDEWTEVPGFMPGKVYKNCKSCGIAWENR